MIVALEGIDGSGKATVAAALQAALAAAGRRAELVSFPRYGETQGAKLIAEMLNGRFKGPSPAYAAALFALDRAEFFAARRAEADILICDRYVMSNVAFQTARLGGPEAEEVGAFIEAFEFDRLGTPRPSLNVLLDVSEATAVELIRRKGARSYTAETLDAYEADRAYQSQVRAAYLSLAERGRGGPWLVVPVAPEREILLTPEDAAARILAALSSR